jgi:hypothetical protein
MIRRYEYQRFTIEVAVQADFTLQRKSGLAPGIGYVAIVMIRRSEARVAVFSPLRLGDAGGRPFQSHGDALVAGFRAGMRIVDDVYVADAR